MLDKALIQKILDFYSCWQKKTRDSGFTIHKIPNFIDVQEILETTFLASIKYEEGQQIEISVVLATFDEVKDSFHGSAKRIHKLLKPIPFSPESVIKLAPAFDPSFSSIFLQFGFIGLSFDPLKNDTSFFFPIQCYLFTF